MHHPVIYLACRAPLRDCPSQGWDVGLEHQSLVAISKSVLEAEDTPSPIPMCCQHLSLKKKEEKRDVRDKVAIYQKEEKNGQSCKTNAEGTTDAQAPEQVGEWPPGLRAEGLLCMAHRAGIYKLSVGPGGGGGILCIQSTWCGVTRPLAPGAESMALHWAGADLTANLPFCHTPTRCSASRGTSVPGDLLEFSLHGKSFGAQGPIKVKFRWCVALSSPPPAELFFAWASSLGSRVSPPWPSSETPTSSVCFDASSLLSHRQPPGCCVGGEGRRRRNHLSGIETHMYVLSAGWPDPESSASN